MLSASFLPIYQKYKRDMDIVASWLATTAQQHGHTTSLAAPPTAGAAANKSAAPSSGRLKGKARKLKVQILRHSPDYCFYSHVIS
ncbi:hypothetical protein BFJ68_g17418 [Fusarium oxysporum]|uniref:DUF6604 domain-containing protein n=1 Tax=Fusarium oxysporum TaxID=5507 RepID=A0A420NTM6_FUSOX|nr:hypothetical protein BFJ71_g16998 [Fusarium oxysporum]RKK83638.1 hypothetical protein BFJ68_g17418 [Fusarium oxysporum]